MKIPERQELIDARKRIFPYIHKTPVFTSSFFNDTTGAELFFKAENLQRMGAFKMRGATNAVLSLSEADRKKGVATHSSGNFAQALALAAKEQGIFSFIVMPENAPQVKKNAVKGYGGKIIECASNLSSREKTLQEVVKETGAIFIHPYNQMSVILGNSTAAQELIEEQDDLDYLFTPVGGGGLISGTAIATYRFSEKTKVIGAEPMGADDTYRSLAAGKILPCINPKTIADGLLTSLGDITFPIIYKLVDRIFCVTEKEILDAMMLVWERMKLIIEPSSAVAVAAILANKKFIEGSKVGVILSGGNMDIKKLFRNLQ